MKYRNLLLSTVTVGLTGSFFLFMPSFETEDSGYSPRRAANEAKSADQAFEHYKSKRLNDNGVYDPELIRTTRNALMTDLQRGVYGSRAVSLSFYEEGPDNIGGRTRAILIEKNNPQLIFAGSVTGGLWASSNGGNTWGRVASFSENLAVSAIAQTGNGRIYVGTGMAFFNEGWVGNGIYYSDDLGTTWTNLNGTTSYAGITEIVADPANGNKIYFGTNNGLKSFDSSVDTAPVSVTTLGTTTCFDIKISPDGQTIVAGVSFSGVRTWVSNDGGGTWTNVSGTSAGLIPSSGRGRIEYAISDTKNSSGFWNIYASAVTSGGGVLAGMYVSEDSGNTWTEIAPASTTGFDPFRTGLNTGQGVYDNVITVLPGEPEKILVGGIDVYAWQKAPGVSPTYGQWEQRSLWFAQPTSSVYVHADNHEMEWDKTTNFLYIGNDGGIGKSLDKGNIFFPANRGYNVTQFYGIAYSKDGDVLGGTQDNGSLLNNHTGTTLQSFKEVRGGDGFDCDISHISDDVMFASVYTGDMQRSDDGGLSFAPIFTAPASAPFHTVGRLYENLNDLNSTEMIPVNLGDENTLTGDTLVYPYPFDSLVYTSYTLQQQYVEYYPNGLVATQDSVNTIYFQDKIQSLYVLGFGSSDGVYVTREALRFSVNPTWKKFLPLAGITFTGSVVTTEFSVDGNHLFVGTSGGEVVRISGFNTFYAPVYDTSSMTTTLIYDGSSSVEAIAVDPNDEDHVVITLAGFSSGRVLESTTAATTTATTSFTNVHGNLANIPVYSAVIPKSDPNVVIIGTEFGVFATDNTAGGSTQWVFQDNGPGIVPVYEIRQQYRDWSEGTNRPGEIYFGTFGRGIWRTDSYLSAPPVAEIKDKTATALTALIFPNPLNAQGKVSFDLETAGPVQMRVVNIQGRVVENVSLGNLPSGKRTVNIDVTNYPSGTYFIQLTSGSKVFNGKMIVTH